MGAETKQKKKIGLTTKIFIALLAGAVFGIVLCYMVPSGHVKDDIIVEGILYVIGQGFIRLMKMLVVPLVFCSLVCGSMAIGDTKKLGTVGVRTLIFYLFTTALAITVALSVGNIINPGIGLDTVSYTHLDVYKRQCLYMMKDRTKTEASDLMSRVREMRPVCI